MSWVIFLCLNAAIAYMSTRPASQLPGILTDWDKLFHMIAYGVLSVSAYSVLVCSIHRNRSDAIKWMVLYVFCYGALMELLQTQVLGRRASWADVAANTLGISIVYVWLTYIKSKQRSTHSS
ncbi:MAG: VanZ family protein [Planctomycetes bacterium]|nr:VanZ family protein [Planctomycetota bacterium]